MKKLTELGVTTMSERDAEKYLDNAVKKAGGFTRKWTSPNHAGVEDRICFFPEGELWFIEVKDTDKLPTSAQWREIMRQRELGHNAGYLAGKEEVADFMYSTNRELWMIGHIMANYNGES